MKREDTCRREDLFGGETETQSSAPNAKTEVKLDLEAGLHVAQKNSPNLSPDLCSR